MERLAGDGGSRRLFGMLDRVRGRLDSADSRSAVLGLIFLEWLGNSRLNGGRYAIQIGDAWRTVSHQAGDALDLEIDLLGQEHPEWAGVVPQIYHRLDDRTLYDLHQQVHATLIEASPGELFDAVLELAAAREGARGGEFASPISLRILLAELAAPQYGTVLDPAAGVGGLLSEAASFARARNGQVRLLGQEINDVTWGIAKMRLAVHGFDADIRRGDSFRSDAFRGQAADHVLTVPPFNQKLSLDFGALGTDPDDRRWRFGVPSPSDASLAWVQHALAHVGPGGRAFVVLSPSAGTRRTGTIIRRELVDRGALEAVIALPPGMFTSTNIPAVIWVLRNEGDWLGTPNQPDDVLFINASQLGMAPHRGPVDLTGDDVELVASTYHHWRAAEKLATRARQIAAAVRRWDLTADDVSFDPDRYVRLGAEDDMLRASATRSPGLIRRLAVENLKSIGGRAEVNLAPITLVYGPNSAGKTTIIQSLLLLKQSLETDGSAAGARLVTQGDAVDMGSFGGLIHGHDESRELRIGLEFEPTEGGGIVPRGLARYVELGFAERLPSPRETDVVLGFGDGLRLPFSCAADDTAAEVDRELRNLFLYEGERGWLTELLGHPLLIAAQPRVEAQRAGRVLSSSRTPQRRRRDLQLFEEWLRHAPEERLAFWSDGFFPQGFLGGERDARDAGRPLPQDQRELLRSLQSIGDELERLWRAPASELKALMEGLAHLGPLRAAPARFHDLSGSGDGAVGSRGENVAAHLYRNARITEEANEWLGRLLVPYEVRVSAVGSAEDGRAIGDVIAMILRDRRSGYEVSPKDVGFGISQLLPIVVHLVTARQSVTCIEQPEIHVHPKLQSEIAELLIESTSEERGNQVIVETHSEHLMLRIQRRIREGVLDPDRVSVIYVDAGEDGAASVQRLRLDELGRFLDPWPHGFFDERLDEIFGGAS